MTPLVARVVLHSDLGKTPREIAQFVGLGLPKVYAILRIERPSRPRALAAEGVRVRRIAVLLGVSRAYCYRTLSR